MATRVCIDVDLTVVDLDGQLRSGVEQNLQKLKAKGCELILWSYGGGEYAQQIALRHKLENLFAGFSGKPDIAIDDESAPHPDFKPIEFKRFGNCGEFAIIKRRAPVSIPSNSTGLEMATWVEELKP